MVAIPQLRCFSIQQPNTDQYDDLNNIWLLEFEETSFKMFFLMCTHIMNWKKRIDLLYKWDTHLSWRHLIHFIPDDFFIIVRSTCLCLLTATPMHGRIGPEQICTGFAEYISWFVITAYYIRKCVKMYVAFDVEKHDFDAELSHHPGIIICGKR